MFKKILTIVCIATVICSVFTGCNNKNPAVSETVSSSTSALGDSDIDFTDDSGDVEIDEDIKTETNSIHGVNYSITGKLYTHALFEDGPHDYSFDRFSANIDSSYDPDLDFADTGAVVTFAEEYSKEKEINNFVVSDLKTEQVSIESLNRSGAIVSFNATNDTDMTFYYKMLVFRADDDFIITAEFNSFYDDREAVVDAEVDKFILNLNA